MKEEMEMKDNASWILAMDEEMTTLRNNDTWDLVPFLMDKNPLNVNGCLKRRLV
jgi:hypothetical protein